jgi:hypothetical protein
MLYLIHTRAGSVLYEGYQGEYFKAHPGLGGSPGNDRRWSWTDAYSGFLPDIFLPLLWTVQNNAKWHYHCITYSVYSRVNLGQLNVSTEAKETASDRGRYELRR